MRQQPAGWRIEPPVSVPTAAMHWSAATAAADPPDEPPGTRSALHGLRVGKKAEFSADEPIANSSRLVLPVTTAPPVRILLTTVQPQGEIKSPRTFDAQEVPMHAA